MYVYGLLPPQTAYDYYKCLRLIEFYRIIYSYIYIGTPRCTTSTMYNITATFAAILTSSLRVWEFVVELYVCSFPIELFQKNICVSGRGRATASPSPFLTRGKNTTILYTYVHACIGMCIIIIIVRIMPTSELTYLWYNMFNTCSVISRWSGNAAVGLTRRNNGAARNPRTTVCV